MSLSALASGGLTAGAGLVHQEPDPARVEQGEALYVENCQPCHGTEGKGDGPAARFLDSRPRDLTRAEWVVIEEGTPEAIFGVISEGVEGTDMEPFSEILEEDEMRAIAAYVAAEIVPPPVEEGGG